MAVLAKGLPILLIPEQHFITPVRNDVVDHGGWGQCAISAALRAERMLSEKQRSGLAPSGIISTDSRTAAHRVMAPFLPVLFAVDAVR